jgi:hypothetical protein
MTRSTALRALEHSLAPEGCCPDSVGAVAGVFTCTRKPSSLTVITWIAASRSAAMCTRPRGQKYRQGGHEWEAQFYLGIDEDEQIDYGIAPRSAKAFLDQLRSAITAVGQRRVARESGVSRRTVERVLSANPHEQGSSRRYGTR